VELHHLGRNGERKKGTDEEIEKLMMGIE